MGDIATKSIGMLVDELITTTIKVHHFLAQPVVDQEAAARLAERQIELKKAIDLRTVVAASAGAGTERQLTPSPAGNLGALVADLTETLIACWDAQERVMNSSDPVVVAPSAKAAQQLNAKRNQLLRAIDQALGEGSISVTEKTYR